MPLFSFAMETCIGSVQGSLPRLSGEITLGEFALFVFDLAEQVHRQAVDVALHAGQGPTTCAPGCGACCRQAVPVSIPEALALHQLVTNGKNGSILARFAHIQARLKSADLDLSLLPGETQDQRWARFAGPYFALGMPCPFLEAESCSIYAQRPTVCRDFIVTSPASECAIYASERVTCIPMPFSLPNSLARLAAVLMGDEPQLLPMPLALDWANAHDSWRSRRFAATLLVATFFDILKAQADLWRGAEEAPPGHGESGPHQEDGHEGR